MSLLKRAIDGGQETVDEATRDERLGAPSLSDAKSALATVLSLEAYGEDDQFATYRMLNGTGAFDTDIPLEINVASWNEAKQMFTDLKDVRDAHEYLPPIIQHVLDQPPSSSKIRGGCWKERKYFNFNFNF